MFDNGENINYFQAFADNLSNFFFRCFVFTYIYITSVLLKIFGKLTFIEKKIAVNSNNITLNIQKKIFHTFNTSFIKVLMTLVKISNTKSHNLLDFSHC